MTDRLTADFWPGEPGRPLIVLIPGLFAGGWIWDAQVTALKMLGWPILRIREAVCVLGRGVGAIDQLSRQVMALARSYGSDPLVLCGVSIGGSIALELAAQFPEDTAGVVATGVPGFGAGRGSGLSMNDRLKLSKAREWVTRNCFYDVGSVPAARVDELLNTLGSNVVGTVCGSRAIEKHPALESATSQSARTLYIWGGEDEVTPLGPWVQTLRELPTTADFVVIDECGHLGCLERPEEYTPHLLDFLISLLNEPSEAS